MRRSMIDKTHRALSVRSQCRLLDLTRSGVYHTPQCESDFNLSLMQQMDKWMLDDPTLGVIGMVDEFKNQEIIVNLKRIRRLMRKMGLMAIYPKKYLSKLGEQQYIRPYLLKGLHIIRPNQVWCVDITYIPMQKGFMYLTAIIDVYSRKIMCWDLSNSLSNECCLEVFDKAIARYGKPEILNSDQGSQFTSKEWISRVGKEGINISMDSKGRALDNIYIERFWRTLKQRYVYLNPEPDGVSLYNGITSFMKRYHAKCHQGIGRISPEAMYQQAALQSGAKRVY